MPDIIEIAVFMFAELTDMAKATARDWYRQGAFDYPWYEGVYGDFEIICDLIGVELKTSNTGGSATRSYQKPSIYFSGFWNQGDGACFEGRYRYRKGAYQGLMVHAPKDVELHQISKAVADVQLRNFYQIRANIVHRGHYCHEYSMAIDVECDSSVGQDMTDDAEEIVKEALRDLARWLYRQFEREYHHLNSDETVDAAIEANAYRFTVDGKIYG